jgi:serine/threonine-protein kinase
MTAWLFFTHHVGSDAEIEQLTEGTAGWLLTAALIWVLYMALEPYVRRRWPQSLISWARLLNGGLKDPVVGGHVLVGTSLGIGYTLFFQARSMLILEQGNLSVLAALGPGRAIGFAADVLGSSAIGIALVIFFLFFLLRVILRRTWLAAGVVVALAGFGAAFAGGNQNPWTLGIFGAVQIGAGVAILVYYGVLPMVLMIFVSSVVPQSPLTTDLSAWYAGSMLTTLAIVLAIALWGFRAALGGRTVWKSDFLDA